MQSFGSIFGEYLKGELLSLFENATVDDIKLDMESRTLRAGRSSARYSSCR